MNDVRRFEMRIPIRWGDMDAMGHVNNTIYFRYLEQARISWFDAVIGTPDQKGCGPILAHVSCDFVKPLLYPGEVCVRQMITRVGRSSVDMDLEILRVDPADGSGAQGAAGEVYARGKSVIVWMDYAAQRSVPWPETLKHRMQPETAAKA